MTRCLLSAVRHSGRAGRGISSCSRRHASSRSRSHRSRVGCRADRDLQPIARMITVVASRSGFRRFVRGYARISLQGPILVLDGARDEPDAILNVAEIEDVRAKTGIWTRLALSLSDGRSFRVSGLPRKQAKPPGKGHRACREEGCWRTGGRIPLADGSPPSRGRGFDGGRLRPPLPGRCDRHRPGAGWTRPRTDAL